MYQCLLVKHDRQGLPLCIVDDCGVRHRSLQTADRHRKTLTKSGAQFGLFWRLRDLDSPSDLDDKRQSPSLSVLLLISPVYPD